MSGSSQSYSDETYAVADRLDSWKEIAAYLKRDVRTAQRWEKTEKLPVRRHLHEKQGTVYAYRPEIDAWSQGRRFQEDEVSDVGAPSAVAEDDEPAVPDSEQKPIGSGRQLLSKRWKRSLLVLGVAAAGALAIYSVHMLWPPPESVVLAVLPFKNMGGSDREALVDGFTTETKTRLEQVQPDRMIFNESKAKSPPPLPRLF